MPKKSNQNPQPVSIAVDIKKNSNPERQFKCKCSKIYMSYPALYTHIKNKHPDDIEEYKLESKKPHQKYIKIEKGRPKKYGDRPEEVQLQGELINTIQLCVIDIQMAVRKIRQSFPEPQCSAKSTASDSTKGKKSLALPQILEHNAQMSFKKLATHYKSIKPLLLTQVKEYFTEYEQQIKSFQSKLSKKSLQILNQETAVKVYKETIRFRKQLIQHFSQELAAKVLLELQLIEVEQQMEQQFLAGQNKKNDDIMAEYTQINEIFENSDMTKIIKHAQHSLWKNYSSLIPIIRKTYTQWKKKLQSLEQLNKHSQVYEESHLNRLKSSQDFMRQSEGNIGHFEYQNSQQLEEDDQGSNSDSQEEQEYYSSHKDIQEN